MSSAYSSAVDRNSTRFRGKSAVAGEEVRDEEKEKDAIYDGSVC
jgi:hypothetical protein